MSTIEGGGDWEDIPGEGPSSERLDDFASCSAIDTLTDVSKPKRHPGMETIFGDNEQLKEVFSTSSRHLDIDTILRDNEQLTEALSTTRSARHSGTGTILGDIEQLKEAPSTSIRHSSIYIFDIFLQKVRLMHVSLSMLPFLCIFALVTGMRLSVMLRTAFVPCYLPFVLRSALCIQPDPNDMRNPKWADFPQFIHISSNLEQLLDESVALSLEFGKGASATADIRMNMIFDFGSDHVRGPLLEMFEKEAKKAASQNLSQKWVVLWIINGYAMRTIRDAEKKAPPPYSLMALNPFRTGLTTQEVMIGAFTSAMDAFAITIQRLILEAEVTSHNFDGLEKHLCAVRGAMARRDLSLERSFIRSICQSGPPLNWLKILDDYQKQTQAHLVAVLQALNSTWVDMEDLRG